MALEALQIALIVSISGMTAISLFTLYLLDRLGTRVKSAETTLHALPFFQKDWKSMEMQRASTSESKLSYEALEHVEKKMEQYQENLKKQIEDASAKTNSLREELAGLNQKIGALTDSLSTDKGTAEALRTEISSIRRKYDEMESMLTEIVRKLLQSRAQH